MASEYGPESGLGAPRGPKGPKGPHSLDVFGRKILKISEIVLPRTDFTFGLPRNDPEWAQGALGAQGALFPPIWGPLGPPLGP